MYWLAIRSTKKTLPKIYSLNLLLVLAGTFFIFAIAENNMPHTIIFGLVITGVVIKSMPVIYIARNAGNKYMYLTFPLLEMLFLVITKWLALGKMWDLCAFLIVAGIIWLSSKKFVYYLEHELNQEILL